MAGRPLSRGPGQRRVRGLPQVSSGGDSREGERDRAAPNALPAREVPENVRPGQSWGAGGRGGRSPAPLPPSPDKWAAGRRRAGGRRQPVEERGPPGLVPRRAQRSLPAGPPRAPPHVNGHISRGAGAGGSGLSSLLRGPPDGRAGRGGRAEGRRLEEPGAADAGSAPCSRLSPGSGRLVAATGTQEEPPGLLSPSLLPRRAALEDFLPPRPPRCPPDMVGHLQLQGMDESLKEKSREGLLDSPDSGLPPSPSPPFYSLSPGEGRAGGSGAADPPGHRREAKDGKVVRAEPGRWALSSRGGKRVAEPRMGGSEGRACARRAGPPRLCPSLVPVLQCWTMALRAGCARSRLQPSPGTAAVPGRGLAQCRTGFSDTLTEMLAVWLGEL